MNGNANAKTLPLSMTVIAGPLMMETPKMARSFKEFRE
jgi:hypothetical protein